jgi:homocysteine S-methyltransferase
MKHLQRTQSVGTHAARPLAPFLNERGWVLLDGGLATALERRGHDLSDNLWSARLLLDAPEEIRAAHEEYLEAGVDCLITSSYQATVPGFERRGLNTREAAAALARSTHLAVEARMRFLESREAGSGATSFPLVAASIGPYGAFLADGSEYDGRYGISTALLRSFHRDRVEILAASGADVLACETLPSAIEVEVLLRILHDLSGPPAWLSFSCRDGVSLWDGTPIDDVVRLCSGHPAVVAVGVNCTAPHHLGALIERAAAATDLPLVAYPNSGERWVAAERRWTEGAVGGLGRSWLDGLRDAWRAGARVVGGCCRIGPEEIVRLRRSVEGRDWPGSVAVGPANR